LIWLNQHPELNKLIAARDKVNTQQQIPDAEPARY